MRLGHTCSYDSQSGTVGLWSVLLRNLDSISLQVRIMRGLEGISDENSTTASLETGPKIGSYGTDIHVKSQGPF